MVRIGRSARTREQRLARRRADSQGFDRGGSRRSFFRSRYAKIFYVVGLVGMGGALLPLLLFSNDDPHGSSAIGGDAGGVSIRRTADEDAGGVGAVEKPTYDVAPANVLDEGFDYIAVFELETGEVRIQLFDDDAPLHVNNFVFLVNEGFYDDLTFHRVVAGQLAQSGSPNATGDDGAGYLLGDEDLSSLAEPLTLADSGLLAMARVRGESSSSQFLITLSPQPQLDSLGFTPFGRVIQGQELLHGLRERDPQGDSRAPAGDIILSARIEPVAAGSADIELPTISAVSGRQQTEDDAAAEPSAPVEEEPGVVDIGAVDKPTWGAAPPLTLDSALDYVAVLELETGTVRIDLFEDIAPIHANNFVFLVEAGFYDGLSFHRVIAGFVAQGGDPTAIGNGGPGYSLPDEELGDNTAALSLEGIGLIAMARSNAASGSQFFITYAPVGFLDAQSFTAFGRVIEGMAAVLALEERDPGAFPPAPAGGRILSATIETTPKSG